MSNILVADKIIPAMRPEALEKVRDLEAALRELPQVDVATDHVLHGGMYARTVCIPAGVAITGAFIRVPTLLIVDGDATVNATEEAVRLVGRHVLAASACRRQAFFAHADTHLTMVFATRAKNVHQAEEEFTDEAHLLASRTPGAENRITITGE